MDNIFQEEIAQGWLKIYMDDIIIATEDDECYDMDCCFPLLTCFISQTQAGYEIAGILSHMSLSMTAIVWFIAQGPSEGSAIRPIVYDPLLPMWLRPVYWYL